MTTTSQTVEKVTITVKVPTQLWDQYLAACKKGGWQNPGEWLSVGVTQEIENPFHNSGFYAEFLKGPDAREDGD